ncbi:MAG: hypothetical protein AMXMBFR33_37060 [Candidatus Xenobia bacterium]
MLGSGSESSTGMVAGPIKPSLSQTAAEEVASAWDSDGGATGGSPPLGVAAGALVSQPSWASG